MNRSIALRAGALFVLFAAVFALVGFASSAPLPEALALISGSVCTLLLAFAAAAPARSPVPVRVRRR